MRQLTPCPKKSQQLKISPLHIRENPNQSKPGRNPKMMELASFPSLACLSNRVRALKRKLHRPYTEYFVGREVNQLCEEWADAQFQNKPLPDPHTFIPKGSRLRLPLPLLHRRLRLPGLLPPPQKGARPQVTPRRLTALAHLPLSLLTLPNPKNVPESPKKSQRLKNLPFMVSRRTTPHPPSLRLPRAILLGFLEAT